MDGESRDGFAEILTTSDEKKPDLANREAQLLRGWPDLPWCACGR